MNTGIVELLAGGIKIPLFLYQPLLWFSLSLKWNKISTITDNKDKSTTSDEHEKRIIQSFPCVTFWTLHLHFPFPAVPALPAAQMANG